jgi:arginine deiminase
MFLNVSSETGRLQAVVVHTPGEEVALVSPEIKDDLLFDDIVFGPAARKEHLEMLEIFRAVMPSDGKILQISELILDVFRLREARAAFITEVIDLLPEDNIASVRDALFSLTPAELYEFAVLGRTKRIPSFALLPSPNILFTRDLAAVAGNNVVLSKAAKKARLRESLLMDILLRHHGEFHSLRHNVIRLSRFDSIEGGDILIASGKVVLIGMSERSSFSGVMRAGQELLQRGFKTILVVDIPKQRASMHLDTIFTFCSPTECLVFPQAITERTDYVVALTMRGGRMITTLKNNLHDALQESLGREITFINCGGDEEIHQLREQWTDGANVFALAPGVVVGYERNTRTFETLARNGYTVIRQHDFLQLPQKEIRALVATQKLAVSFEGNELCRGRGGARCMTLPLKRT